MLLPAQMLTNVARNYRGKVAYSCGSFSRTWSEMDDRSTRLNGALAALGVRAGDAVAILGQESIEIYEHYFACMKGGYVRVGINWRYASNEVFHILRDCNAKFILVDARCQPLLEETLAIGDLPGLTVIGYGDVHAANLDYERCLLRGERVNQRHSAPNDPLVVSYTSGSTGVPKGVIHSHQSVAMIIYQAAISRGLTTDDVWTAAIASSWMACTLNMIGLANGMTTVIMDGVFDVGDFIEDARRHKISAALLVPTIMGRVLGQVGGQCESLSSLRLLMYGSSPAPADLLRSFHDAFGCRMMQTYGMTEGGWVSHLMPSDHILGLTHRPELLRSAGRGGGLYQLSIRDESGREVANGERGEIWVNGPTTMLGYLNHPSETSEAMQDGWLKTNDIGYFDDEYLYLVDRKKFLIITGAVNVFPATVEAVLCRHPDIAEISVVGTAHPHWGEAVVAVIVTKDGRALPSVEDLNDFARSNLSRPELPKHVLGVPDLPKTVTGKIDKKSVKQWVDSQAHMMPWEPQNPMAGGAP